MIPLIIQGAATAVVMSCVGLMIRVHVVHEYRTQLLQMVSAATDKDIQGGFDWHWRFDAFGQVGFTRMVYTFWKRPDSFYPDKSFTDPLVIRVKQR